MKVLDNCKNMFDNMSPVMKKEIRKYINDPTLEQWDKIAHYIINPVGQMWTVWNAVLEVDPTFPKEGRATDLQGNVVREWRRIPEPFIVLKGIKYVTGEEFA